MDDRWDQVTVASGLVLSAALMTQLVILRSVVVPLTSLAFVSSCVLLACVVRMAADSQGSVQVALVVVVVFLVALILLIGAGLMLWWGQSFRGWRYPA